MKLQIVRENQEPIGGYEIIKMNSPNSLELSSVVDNSCELILAADLADSFHTKNIPQLCQALISKLRLRGELIVGGTDVRLFTKHVLNGLISNKDACEIVCSTYAMSTSDMIVDAFKSFGLTILSVHMDGIHYEVKAVRK
jgi:hypothetical protein